ncbi:MAG: 4Fe-4S binding protein [Spirochaetales bacterium]|nr:4Fe-4S binding protein [Spirochaetales bacterium]
MSEKTSINETIAWQDITPGGNIYSSGNSINFHTGDWRTNRPILALEKCSHCLLCVPVCPDSSIPIKDGKRQDFDYDHCKGCGICAKACPLNCISMIPEGSKEVE